MKGTRGRRSRSPKFTGSGEQQTQQQGEPHGEGRRKRRRRAGGGCSAPKRPPKESWRALPVRRSPGSSTASFRPAFAMALLLLLGARRRRGVRTGTRRRRARRRLEGAATTLRERASNRGGGQTGGTAVEVEAASRVSFCEGNCKFPCISFPVGAVGGGGFGKPGRSSNRSAPMAFKRRGQNLEGTGWAVPEHRLSRENGRERRRLPRHARGTPPPLPVTTPLCAPKAATRAWNY